MEIIYFLIIWLPLFLSALAIIWLLILELKKGEVSSRTAGKFLIFILAVFLFDILAKMIVFYFQLKGHPVGQFLLPSQGSSYLYWTLWDLSQSLVWSLAIALSICLFLWLFRKISKRPIFVRADIFIFILASVVVGPSSILVLILGSFLLMAGYQIFKALKTKKIDSDFRIKIAPILLGVAFLILILKNFLFYSNFLDFFHLL